jgi:hypothetical protein
MDLSAGQQRQDRRLILVGIRSSMPDQVWTVEVIIIVVTSSTRDTDTTEDEVISAMACETRVPSTPARVGQAEKAEDLCSCVC